MSAADTVRDEPLLQCGHPLSALVSGRDGRYCGACMDALLREPHADADLNLEPPPVGPVQEILGGNPKSPETEPEADPDDTADDGGEEDEQHSPVTVEADADESEPLEGDIIEPGQPTTQPVYGTLATSPGPRGCWALKVDGQHCGAAARRGEPYCNAHAGVGLVATDPAAANTRANESRRRTLEHRARMRIALGDKRPTSARGMLRAAAAQHSSRVAGRVIDAILDPESDSLRAGKLALDLIREVEPVSTVEVSLGLPSDPAALDALSLRELRALAEASGLDVSGLDAPVPAVIEAP